ncbi:MAG: DinB family protein [Anaerolineae bacterium]
MNVSSWIRAAAPHSARHAAIAAVLGLAGFAAGLLAPPPSVRACSCLPPLSPAEARAAADVVFRGTVVALATTDEGVTATLRVRAVWKGPIALVLSVRTADNSAACGYPFRLGADMIVYAHAVPVGGGSALMTTSCDRTADHDAAEAGALGLPRYGRPADDPPAPNCPRCPIPSAAGALASADVAFLGRPLRVVDVGAERDWARHVRFRVLGTWKGDVPAEVDVAAPYLAWACRGQDWLDDDAGAIVYAERAVDGSLSVSICGRLERYDAADAATLGPMRAAFTKVFLPLAARWASSPPFQRATRAELLVGGGMRNGSTCQRKRTVEAGIMEGAMVDWVPPGGRSSIGTVLYHIADIEADWLYVEVLEGDLPPAVAALFPYGTRDAAGKLTHVPGYTLEQHLDRLATVRRLLNDVFRDMTLAEFRRVRSFEPYDVSAEWVLHHLSQHEAEHRGQIGAIRDEAEVHLGVG